MRIAREYFLTEDLTHRGCPGCADCPGACAGTSVGGAEDLLAELELHLGVPDRGDSMAERTERLLGRLKMKGDPIFKAVHLTTERKMHPPIVRHLFAGLESSGTSVAFHPWPWNEAPMAASPPSRNDDRYAGHRLSATKLFELGPRLRLLNPFREDDPALGKALHAFFAAFDPSSSPSASLALAHGLLDACGVEHIASPESLVEAAQRLHGLIQRQWPESEIWWELPLRMRTDGPIVQGIADMIVASPNGFHLVEHKTFPGRKDLCRTRAVAAGPQLQAYAEILGRATGKPCRTLYAHFPFPGVIVKLK